VPTVTLAWELPDLTVTVEFTPVRSTGHIPHVPPAALAGVTSRVRVTVETLRPRRCRQTAEFTAAEVATVFGNRWPDEGNAEAIRRAVAERKAYPVPVPEPPPERSDAAQGQTRKPGSHGGAQHRRK
jgi:hypothetical protein